MIASVVVQPAAARAEMPFQREAAHRVTGVRRTSSSFFNRVRDWRRDLAAGRRKREGSIIRVRAERSLITTAISTSRQIDLQVAEFARQHGLESVLPLVGDLTERLFPMAQAIDVELVADDEQPDQRSLFFNVRGLDIEPRLGSELHWQWAAPGGTDGCIEPPVVV